MEKPQAGSEDAVAPPSPVVIDTASYLGGHRKLGDERLRHLKIAVDEHGWTVTQSVQTDVWGRELRENRLCSIPWETVRTVEIEADGRHAPNPVRSLMLRFGPSKALRSGAAGTPEGSPPAAVRVRCAPLRGRPSMAGSRARQ